MYKAIIFDFFGVISSEVYRYFLLNRGQERTGIFSEIITKLDTGELSFDDFIQANCNELKITPQIFLSEMYDLVKINRETLAIIENLKKNYKISLLSNASSEFIRSIINNNNLEKYFDEIVISSEVHLAKPDKKIFELTLSRLNVAPTEVIFIDDSEKNTTNAENLGIKSITFTNAKNLDNQLKNLLS